MLTHFSNMPSCVRHPRVHMGVRLFLRSARCLGLCHSDMFPSFQNVFYGNALLPCAPCLGVRRSFLFLRVHPTPFHDFKHLANTVIPDCHTHMRSTSPTRCLLSSLCSADQVARRKAVGKRRSKLHVRITTNTGYVHRLLARRYRVASYQTESVD